MTVGEKIRALRIEKGVTQEELGRALRFSPQAVSKWENNAGNPDITLVAPLCHYFGISADELCGVENERIREIFGDYSLDSLDEEMITTINKFFENSLNVSETSRQLYIHRNTLVYRLDKLQKSTNLDLRVFEDAITFKIALMVVKYMKYMESIEY